MQYEHKRIITLPFKHEEKLIAPVIKQNHIWSHDEYVTFFSDDDIKKCIRYDNKTICDAQRPIFRKHQVKKCEWQLINNDTTDMCEYKVANESEYWTQVSDDQWLFSFKNDTKIFINCENEENEIRLKNIGKLKIDTNCEILTPKYRLVGKKEITTTNNNTLHVQVHNITWPGKMNPIEFKEKIKKTIDDLENTDAAFFKHHMHHYVSIYATMVAIVIVVCYFYSKLELAPMP